MRDHAKLVQHWQEATGDMAQRLATVNAIMESGPRQPIDMKALQAVLVERGKFRALQIHAAMGRTTELRQRLGQPDVSPGVKAAAHLLGLIDENVVLQVSQFGVLKKLLDDICADSVIGPDDASATWVLSSSTVPWWKNTYGRPISTFDLIEAQLVVHFTQFEEVG
jgi:hypothetical protein